MEKDCKWYFGNEGGIDIGPNDPIHENFKGNPYYSIVRESIQNSLDAVNNEKEPVKVSFTTFEISRNDFPNLFEIENHIKRCKEYYHNNNNADWLFSQMLYYLNGDIEGKKRVKLTCMKVADYNTIGMKYDDSDTKSPFYAFLRAAGVTVKSNQGAGGSFGFGKGAYFALSPLKTLLVSSMDMAENVYFEGTTRLTTHKDESNKKLTAYGFYDSNKGEPVQDINAIPDVFKRKETGTDINIIGLWDEKYRKSIMVKSVLNNFWLAIYHNKLSVQIEDILINRENLEQIIDEYFSEENESGTPTEVESWNPKSYFKAVKYANSTPQFKVFESELETLGKMKFYVYLEKGLPNRTSYFRKPKMVVFKRTSHKIKGYSAVLVCESDKGNKILRDMENPAHNVWDLDNYPKNEGKIDATARKAISELNKFVNDSLESLSKIKTGKKLAFLGLEEYLSIPEDLLEKDEEFDFEGNVTNSVSGNNSNETAEKETGSQTTTNVESVKIKATAVVKHEVPETTDIEPTEDGTEKITTGGENETSGGNDNPTDSGDNANTGERANETNPTFTRSKVLVNVRFRILAQKSGNNVEHILLVNVDKDIENAELALFVGADNGREDGIEIFETDNGNIEKNILKNVYLWRGKNEIKIRFADNVKHSVKLKAYEYQ